MCSVSVPCVSGCLLCAKAEEKGQRGQLDDGEEPRPSVVGVPGLTAKSDWKPPPETQQQVIEFRKCQAEERKVKKQNNRGRPIKRKPLFILPRRLLRAPSRGWS